MRALVHLIALTAILNAPRALAGEDPCKDSYRATAHHEPARVEITTPTENQASGAPNFDMPPAAATAGDLQAWTRAFREPGSAYAEPARRALSVMMADLREAIHERARIQDYPDLLAATEPGKELDPELLAQVVENELKGFPESESLAPYSRTRKWLVGRVISKYFENLHRVQEVQKAKTREALAQFKPELLAGEVDWSQVPPDVKQALWPTLSLKDIADVLARWHAAQGETKEKLGSILKVAASKLGIYEPHSLAKLEKGLGAYLSGSDLREPRPDQLAYTTKQRGNEPFTAAGGSVTSILSDNIPGYEPGEPFVSTRKPEPIVMLAHEVAAEKGFIPTYRHVAGPELQLQRYGGAPRGAMANGDFWLKDRKPLAISVEENGRRHLVLAGYENPLYGNQDGFRVIEPPPSRPHDVDPKAVPYQVGIKTVWAIPEQFGVKMQGGNFIQTKDHVIMTNRVEIDNGKDWRDIAPDVARVTCLRADQVHRIVSAPGELTGHADLVVGTLDFNRNAVAVPTIPEYALEYLKSSDPARYELARRMNAEYYDQVANELSGQGLTVRRVPMLAPQPIETSRGKSMSPFGVDARFLSTVNWVLGQDNTMMVPVYSTELAKMPPEAQRRFHQDVASTLKEFGLRYQPVDASSMIQTNGGLACVTWTAPDLH